MKKLYSMIAAAVILINSFAVSSVSAASETLKEQSPLENVALNKTVTVSKIGLGKSAYITDGVSQLNHTGNGTKYAHFCNVDPDDSGVAWAVVDLGKAFDIRKVVVQITSASQVSGVTLSVSADNENWTEVRTKSDSFDWYGESWSYNHPFAFDEFCKGIRYVKISRTAGFTLGEIQVYASLGYEMKKIQIAGATASDQSGGSIYGAIIDEANVYNALWGGVNSTGKTIDGTFDFGSSQQISTIYLTPHSNNSVRNNFKVYVGDSVDANGHVEKTDANLVYSQGESNYADVNLATLAIEADKKGRYVTVSRNALAAGEENSFTLANFAAYGPVEKAAKAAELTNVALNKTATGESFDDTNMVASRVTDGKRTGWAYCSKEWNYDGVVVDLASWYNVRKLALTMVCERNQTSNAGTRQYIEVWGSATGEFGNEAILLMDTGAKVRDLGETVTEDVITSNIVRYIKVKPKHALSTQELAGFSTIFAFSEIEVYADASKEYTMANGADFTYSVDDGSTYNAAGKLADGLTSTELNLGTKNGFILNLGNVYNVAAIQLNSSALSYNYKASSGSSARRNYRISTGLTASSLQNQASCFMRDFPWKGQSVHIFDEPTKTEYLKYAKPSAFSGAALWTVSNPNTDNPADISCSTPYNEASFTNINLSDINVFYLAPEEVVVSDAAITTDPTEDDFCTFNANIYNGTGNQIYPMAVLAIYDSEMHLKNVLVPLDEIGAVNSKASAKILVEMIKSEDGYVEGDIIKGFILEKDTLKPYCDVVTP